MEVPSSNFYRRMQKTQTVAFVFGAQVKEVKGLYVGTQTHVQHLLVLPVC